MGEEIFFKVYVLWKSGLPYEVRRFGIEKSKLPSFSVLVQRLQEIMPDLAKVKYSVTWRDEEGDEVVVSTDDEVKIALLKMADLVKLHIYCEEKHDSADTRNVVFTAAADAGASSSAEHSGVVCDSCDNAVVGFRYKCTSCIDYDLCTKCEAAGAHPEHCMVRIPMPGMPRSVIKEAVKHSRHFLKTVASKIEEDHCKKRRDPSSERKRRGEHGRPHGHGHGHSHRHRGGHEHQRRQHSSWFDTFASYMNEFADLTGDVNIEIDTSFANKTTDQANQPAKEAPSSSTKEQPQGPSNPQNCNVINIQKILEKFLVGHNIPQQKESASNNFEAQNKAEVPENQSQAAANNDVEMGQGDRKVPEEDKESVKSSTSSEKDDTPDETDNWTVINAEKDLMDDDKLNDPTPPIGFKLPEEFRDHSKATGGLYPPLNIATASLNPKEPEVKEPESSTNKPQPSAPTEKPEPKPKPEPRKRHPLPHIDAAIDQMLAMGFTNEGEWLTQILENKNGNIAAVLDLLTPVNPKK
ncbi:sequestosome-1-like [Danaus plexippus]|uniref:Sequestosome-1 like protein n=1 Tax=Danaus plexippus plexippus TaxID=278856 RepID=A0A212FLJ9_DANPL|nr:sequestosome-1-like [Danaus plexippus]XP_032528634.1 sequestosome-1-like [Danaus plexippus]XP_032528635.1 sequestosome-1-like [Danaus plexippus]OWR54628.1 sequestosome-1 like protein [Danaus plexippus plexippus]